MSVLPSAAGSVETPAATAATAPRCARGIAVLCVLALAACVAPTMAATAPDVGISSGGATKDVVTQKDVDNLLNSEYREAALKRLIRKTLIDQQAKAAGIGISSADADAAIAKWKETSLGGSDLQLEVELAKQGLTLPLYREVVRENLIVHKLLAPKARLVDTDYDEERVLPIVAPTEVQAEEMYEALAVRKQDLGSVVGMYHAHLIPMLTIYRYDNRFDRKSLLRFWQDPADPRLAPVLGDFLKPMPSIDGTGYMVVQVKEQINGKVMPAADRAQIGPALLQIKTSLLEQDWWTELEKQVIAAYNRAVASSPAG